MRVRRPSGAELKLAPVVATPRAVALNTAVLFAGGGVLAGVSTVLAGGPVTGVGQIRLLSAGALAVAVGLLLAGDRLPRWTFHLVLVLAWSMVSLGVFAAGDSTVASNYALYYLLVALNAFTACSWAGAGFHLLLGLAGVIGVLSVRSGTEPAKITILAGVLVLVCVYVGRVVRAAGAAEVDALTGLVNRRGLDRRLDVALSSSQRNGLPLSLVLIDLDHFKQVNDREGHAAGDQLLRAVAAAWSELMPPGSVLARPGGDEFVLLVDGPEQEAASLADRLRAALPPGRTCSAGTARWRLGEQASELVARADAALYEAKRAARGTTVIRGTGEVAPAIEVPASR